MSYLMKEIIREFPFIKARRKELLALMALTQEEAKELSDLEAKHSLFDDLCMRVHLLNLCKAGFLYGEMLRHPVDPAVGIEVRLRDQVVIVEGPDAGPQEMSIIEASRILGNRMKRGAALRLWEANGVTLGDREDALKKQKDGLKPSINLVPLADHSHVKDTPDSRQQDEAENSSAEAGIPKGKAKKRKQQEDTLTLDLFG